MRCKECKNIIAYGSTLNPKWYCKLDKKIGVLPWLKGENPKCPLNKKE